MGMINEQGLGLMAGRVKARLAVLVACAVVTAGVSGGSRGGTLAAGGCLTGTPTAAYFAQAKALARSVGARVPLPIRAPRTAQLASFCVYPPPKSATDLTPGVGYPQFGFFRGRRPSPDPSLNVDLRTLGAFRLDSNSYATWVKGDTIAFLLARNGLQGGTRKTMHLGVYTVIRATGKFGPSDPPPCLRGVFWFFKAAGFVLSVYGYLGTCDGVPAGSAAGSAAPFIASLRPAY